MNRALYPLGFLLLVGTLVGATWALQSGSHPAGKGNGEREATPVVACPGYVDVRSGVSQLYPKQYGEVESIAETKIKENDGTERDRAFKKGEVIVQLKSAMAEYTVKKAKAALRAAESELTKAKLLHDDKKVKLKMQQAAIDAYKHEKARLTAEFEVKKELAKQADTPLNKLQLKQIEEALAEAGEKIKIEEGKLEQIKLIDPELEISRAEADVEVKKLDVKTAEEALKDFRLVAPFDGVVLHLNAHVGELVGPNPARPAVIEFCPSEEPRIVKAEVMQEWGHKVKLRQSAIIKDDAYDGAEWTGKVISLADDYKPKVRRVFEPFFVNDVLTRECIIEFTEKQPPPVRIGQRVRVKIKL